MTAIHVRNVSESTLSGLRERAAAHGRSMQREVLAILQAAAAEPVPSQAPEPIELVTAHTGGDGTWRREEIYGDQSR